MAGDPYKELGVARGASAAEIKSAYRKLAKQLHPDSNPGDKAAEERFKRVTAAFDILGDAAKKAKFDRGEIDADGREQFRGFSGRPGAGGSPFGQAGGARGAFEDVDLEEIFGGMFGGGTARGGRGFATKGQDVRATLEVTLEDSISGATRRIQFSDGRMLDVAIPKGAGDGQVIRLKGQGGAGRGGPAGDALIELKIARHPLFTRDGPDLTMDQPVALYDAVLGGKVPVRTPEGTVMMTIPKGSSSGKILRLKGRGAFADGKRGDLLAKLMIVLPEADDRLTKLAETARDEGPIKPFRD
ncbi:MAG: DnaJ domain-containing protein [Alphaproteobacteria bacterium]|nr:DnaJ domain-containing protein [Alphaproteobacteria bacterium]MBU1526849.1 DnaJ domain-containing protein [Alphaproteobacteria bacterium]MBU2118411.1 DnaJ domain-containing protein [Alphaproteobacteria bacterium]MBU2351682.1 DnaJ domain-containing protein [Alphaproteobacteria bacterium]MBU2382566.1 DnaJ domain-containing protein [Alphaproteobacteria bacterium]